MEAAVSHSEGVALLRQVFDWLRLRDMDAFLGALDPDVEAHPSLGEGTVLHGRAEVRAWLSQFADVDHEFEVRPLEFEERGDCVLVRGYLRHRAERTLAENQVYWVCKVCNGQIVRMESHPTRSAALRAC